MSSFANITVDPKSSLLDELVHIKITNLQPGQHITIKSHLKEDNSVFTANGHYMADINGTVDCMTMSSYGGSFVGCEPMGLICYLMSEEGFTSGKRIRKKDITSPHLIDFSVLDSEGMIIAKCGIKKYYKTEEVLRIPIHQGNVRGTLFSPNHGKGEYPAIIDLYGSTGGLPEYRAAILASRGFLVLALAYSQYEDLPKDLKVDLEYFEEAIEFLTSHKNSFKNNEVGVIGLSFGATLAMDIALISQKVKAVVLIGASSYRSQAIKYKNTPLPHTTHPMTVDNVTYEDNMVNIVCYSRLSACTNHDSIIKIQDAKHSHFLILHGVEDQNTHFENALKIAENLKNNDHNNYSLNIYQGTGHLIEPPYMPFNYASWHRLFQSVIINGGNAKFHSHAQENAWKNIIHFFNDVLNSSKSLKSNI